MAQHTDVLLYLLGMSLILISVFVGMAYKGLQKTLSRIDSRHELTECKVETIDKRLIRLETKHDMIHGEESP
jgi:uncharacterized protein YoxC